MEAGRCINSGLQDPSGALGGLGASWVPPEKWLGGTTIIQSKHVVIENADATPPHLDVFLHLGCSGDLLGSLKFVCIDLAKHPNIDWKIIV